MKSLRTINNIFFAVLCTIFITSKSFAEPVNIYNVREALHTYYDSGEYLKDISKVAKEANDYIEVQVSENLKNLHPKKLAVVLDIDETSLSYYESMSKRNFCYNPIAAQNEILKARAPAIQPVLYLYNNAIKNNVAVFFITGRESSTHQATIMNLNNAGYIKFAGLYTKPENYNKNSIQEFKTKTRILIEKQGYTIIASIGDQMSDLKGGHAAKTFKLPNPYYYIG
jgi:predicted secreted acid phosphatase